jgi:hypothetical protein
MQHHRVFDFRPARVREVADDPEHIPRAHRLPVPAADRPLGTRPRAGRWRLPYGHSRHWCRWREARRPSRRTQAIRNGSSGMQPTPVPCPANAARARPRVADIRTTRCVNFICALREDDGRVPPNAENKTQLSVAHYCVKQTTSVLRRTWATACGRPIVPASFAFARCDRGEGRFRARWVWLGRDAAERRQPPSPAWPTAALPDDSHGTR